MSRHSVWIINPYGTLPSESWATYRSTMLAESLARHGYDVTQFISNFEHRSKTFRSQGLERLTIADGYTIRIISGSGYDSHISLRRIWHERTFARNLVKSIDGEPRPDFVILAEPALFYYDILLAPLIAGGHSLLVLDIIDIWPELFELVIPRKLRPFSKFLLGPLHYWRKRLYRYPSAIVAVSNAYLELARRLTTRSDVLFATVYWSYSVTQTGTSVPTPPMQELVAGKGESDIWIVYAGTLGENYDIHSIIDVARRLPDDVARPVKFIVAGDGPLKRLCEENVSNDFVFLGRLGTADLDLLYEYCDVALSTYKGESTVAMPIKAFDYLRHGLPVVNSLGRDIGEFVRRDRIGLNYDPESPSSLYQSLKRLVCDEKLRRSCAENARRLADEFRPDRQYATFVNVLDRLSHRR